MALWLDASYAAGITHSGGAISQMDDLSGNGNHATQSVVAERPTLVSAMFNSLDAVRIDKPTSGDTAEGLITGLDLTGITIFEIFVVCGIGATAVGYVINGSVAGGYGLRNAAGNRFQWGIGGGSSATSAPLTLDTIHIEHNHKASGAAALVYHNGALLSGVGASGNTLNVVGLGAEGTFAVTTGFEMWFCEMLIYDTGLTVANRNTIHTAMKAKWATPTLTTIT